MVKYLLAVALGLTASLSFAQTCPLGNCNYMYLNQSNGNVGIGTANPIRLLTLAGAGSTEFIVKNTSASSNQGNARIRSADNGGTNYMLFGKLSDDGNTGTDYMTMNLNSGYVGIGTSTPATTLDVNGGGAGGVKPMRLKNSSASSGHYYALGPDGSSNCMTIYDQNNSGVYMCEGASSWSSSSDARLKKDIVDLPSIKGLSAVSKLRPVIFKWRTVGSPSTTQLGFIAQDVQKILPEIITHSSARDIIKDNGRKETIEHPFGVEYTGLIVPLVKAVQELKAQNDQLRNDFETYKKNHP